MQGRLDLFLDRTFVAVQTQSEGNVPEDAHREGIGLLKYHPDMPAHGDRIDLGVINVLAAEDNVSSEAKPAHQIVHAIEAAQDRALAASRGADESGDGAFFYFQSHVAHGFELAVVQLRNVAIDQGVVK